MEKQLDAHKLEEIEFANKRYALEDSSIEEYQKTYSQRKFYSIARAGGDYVERVLLQGSRGGEENSGLLLRTW